MDHIMILSAAAVAQASSAPAGAPPSAPIAVTPDNVELNGAGTFTFRPDENAFEVDAPKGAGGRSFIARLWFDPAGRPIECTAGDTAMAAAASTACDQLKQSARFERFAGLTMPYRRGFVDVQFSFFTDPPGRKGRAMFAIPNPYYRNVVLDYPDETAAERPSIDPADGRIIVAITTDDYPPDAMRYALESASTVLLGIDRQGSIRSCRPIGEAAVRSARLDNHTCRLMIERARFAFTDAAAGFDGLRYIRKTMRWMLPR